MSGDFLDRCKLEELDDLCIQYGAHVGIPVQDCPCLRLLFDDLESDGVSADEISRRIALAFEIKLGFLQATYELQELAGLENLHLVPEDRRRQYRPLERVDSFSIAMRRIRSAF